MSDESMLWQVGKNAFLCEALEEYFPSKRDELDSSKLEKLASKVGLDPPYNVAYGATMNSLE